MLSAAPCVLSRCCLMRFMVDDVVVQSLRHAQLFATPWTAACQVSLSFTISQSLLELLSIRSVVPSNHRILCPSSSCLQSFSPSQWRRRENMKLLAWLEEPDEHQKMFFRICFWPRLDSFLPFLTSLPFILFFYCGKSHIRHTILTILNCTVQWH